MKNNKSKIILIFIVFVKIFCFSSFVQGVTFDEINQPNVFVKHKAGTGECTLAAAVNLVRRAAMATGNTHWEEITLDSMRGTAWLPGLSYGFTFAGITVRHGYLNGTSHLIQLLKEHPEGIVTYNRSKPHAILVTDYTNGTFYCADSDPYGPSGRIPDSSALVTAASCTEYWYVSSPKITLTPPSGKLDVSGILDDEKKASTEGFGYFDVYINDELVAAGVDDYVKTDLKAGTKYAIKNIHAVNGYSYEGTDPITGTIAAGQKDPIHLKFKSCKLKVFGYLDGVVSPTVNGYGTFDVYIDGVQEANDVKSYSDLIRKGAQYEIKDIKTVSGHVYNGVWDGGGASGIWGGESGTIVAGETKVALSFDQTGELTCDWTEVNRLPGNITTSNCEIQYNNHYEKVSSTSPGSGWTQVSGSATTKIENVGDVYESDIELSTSPTTRKEVSFYYYHYCGNSNKNYVEHFNDPAHGCTNRHIESSVNVKEIEKHDDDTDSRYKYYVLQWTAGQWNGGTMTCPMGSKYFYKMYKYQDLKEVTYYTWVKDSGWTTTKDSSADSVSYRYRLKNQVSSISIKNSGGSDVTGKTLTTKKAANQFSASASPAAASQKFTWKSSDTNIATVDSTGKVTFKKAGTVTITVKAGDCTGKTATFKLTYNAATLATAVKIQNSSGTDITGKTVAVKTATYQLKAVATPSGAAQKFTWTSGSTGIATVDANGKVTFKKAGSVKITATASDGSKKAASVTLKYTPLATAVKMQNSSGTDITGKTVTVTAATYQLKAVATPTGAAQKFTWTSGSTGIATVDANGKVTFKKAGSVKITATASDGSKKAASVTLKYTPLATAVKMQNSSGTDITGKTVTVKSASYQLKAVATPSTAAQKFTWASSNTGIATVDSNGKVTFKKAGTVKITATASDGSKKAASVSLKYTTSEKPVLEIKDTNIRGKNKEIQIVVPWSEDLMKVECRLYDDLTNEEVKPTFRERMDSTGKNRVVSYVGAPLVNGDVYRFEIRVYNGQWSNTVEKYAMPIPNVYGATVTAGNKAMSINNQHREPTDGARYMLFDASTEKEIAYMVGTRNETTWKYDKLTNGKLYYVVAVPYRDYWGQRLWGPNENRIYFIPMGIPSNGKVSFSGSNAAVSISADSTVDGIRVLYRTVGGALKNGCEGKGAKCTISGLNKNTAYEFYAMKYKVAGGRTYYSMGTLIPYKTEGSGLTAPQMNPVVAMNNSGYTTFTIKKSSNAEGISVLYKMGSGNFVQACEKAGNTCAATLDVTKNYTFYIMQYKTVNGKKVYSPGIVARDFSSMKNGEFERMYTGFTLADESIDMNEIYDALDGYMGEDALLMAEALAVMGEDMVSKGTDEFESDTFYEDDGFDYSAFDSDEPYGEYEGDAYAESEDPYEDSFDPDYNGEYGPEMPDDNMDESQESVDEEFSMFRFDGDDYVTPSVPSFGN